MIHGRVTVAGVDQERDCGGRAGVVKSKEISLKVGHGIWPHSGNIWSMAVSPLPQCKVQGLKR